MASVVSDPINDAGRLTFSVLSSEPCVSARDTLPAATFRRTFSRQVRQACERGRRVTRFTPTSVNGPAAQHPSEGSPPYPARCRFVDRAALERHQSTVRPSHRVSAFVHAPARLRAASCAGSLKPSGRAPHADRTPSESDSREKAQTPRTESRSALYCGIANYQGSRGRHGSKTRLHRLRIRVIRGIRGQ